MRNTKYREAWSLSSANEFGRLANGIGGRIKTPTNTVEFIFQHEVPTERMKDITYGQFVCTVRPEKAEPNRTRCLSTSCPHTASTVMGGVARYDASYFRGNPDYTALVAGRAMMEEIMENGPVVSVLKLSVDDFQRFSDWKGEQHVFVANATATRSVWHCVVVYGWGQDARSGHNYWLVHNSYGVQWGDMGTARVARGGALELEWRGLYTIPSPPASTAVVKTGHRAPLSLPNTDIVVVTFVSCMLLALLLLYFLSKTKRMF
jgi:hypothetical protein